MEAEPQRLDEGKALKAKMDGIRNQFPPEMFRAFFPSSHAVKGALLHAPTLAHIVMMSKLQCLIDMDEHNAIIAAYVLSFPSTELGLDIVDADRFALWMSKHGCAPDELKAAVSDLISTSLRAAVFDESKSKKQSDAATIPTGYGWPLEVAEKICFEYGWNIDTVKHMPICVLFGLIACGAKRNGKENGPSYYERMALPEVLKIVNGGGVDNGK
jgi:hypothetical protein